MHAPSSAHVCYVWMLLLLLRTMVYTSYMRHTVISTPYSAHTVLLRNHRVISAWIPSSLLLGSFSTPYSVYGVWLARNSSGEHVAYWCFETTSVQFPVSMRTSSTYCVYLPTILCTILYSILLYVHTQYLCVCKEPDRMWKSTEAELQRYPAYYDIANCGSNIRSRVLHTYMEYYSGRRSSALQIHGVLDVLPRNIQYRARSIGTCM